MAAKELDKQRAADIESLIHVGVHLRIRLHSLAGNIAQDRPQPARHQDKQRQDEYADHGQPPFERGHNNQQRDRFDQVGHDADEGVADGILRPNHVIV